MAGPGTFGAGGGVECKSVKDSSRSGKFLDGGADHLRWNCSSSSLCSCVLYRRKAFGFFDLSRREFYDWECFFRKTTIILKDCSTRGLAAFGVCQEILFGHEAHCTE